MSQAAVREILSPKTSNASSIAAISVGVIVHDCSGAPIH